MPDITLKLLQQAVQGLLYPSEQDKPVKAVFWPQAEIGGAALDASLVEKQIKAKSVTSEPLGNFFGPVTTEQSWQSEVEKTVVHRFQALEAQLQSLASLAGFRAEESQDTSQSQIYVLGKTAAGDIAGIMTTVVET